MIHQLTQEHNGQTLQLAPGDVVELTLEENPTTGYTWSAAANNPLLVVEDSRYERQSLAVGGGGLRRFTFRMNGPGAAALELKNRQPWSGDVYQTFTVHLEAQGAN